jgi:hypothetical protein
MPSDWRCWSSLDVRVASESPQTKKETDMPGTALNRDEYFELIVEYLDLLHRQGIITDLREIDTEAVIRTTEELRYYFMTLHTNDVNQ